MEKHHVKLCTIYRTLDVIGGKWKPVILWFLSDGTKRFGELKKSIQGISEKMLISSLKDLESEGIIDRFVYHSIPPKVEYSLTEKGQSILPILMSMNKWGEENMAHS